MSEAEAFALIVRYEEFADRERALSTWRMCDMGHARDWRAMQEQTGIDTREDVKRNVRYARHWNHLLIRMRIARISN